MEKGSGDTTRDKDDPPGQMHSAGAKGLSRSASGRGNRTPGVQSVGIYDVVTKSSPRSYYEYLHEKARAMSDYAIAKQFLSETDEAWAERVERLASAVEETGGEKPTDEDIANKFIMSSDASRHSDAIDRHEEHLNMVRTAGISDPVWRTLTIQCLASKLQCQ